MKKSKGPGLKGSTTKHPGPNGFRGVTEVSQPMAGKHPTGGSWKGKSDCTIGSAKGHGGGKGGKKGY